MSDIIQLLSDNVANQIAAGEVVQRPASVVKELLENAIDAQATSIDLIIKDAGKTLIQVADDGTGMTPTDARLSFERHATSKIRKAKDLFALHTKGFRGEALASIAAIAHVDLKTKRKDDELGTEISIRGSKFMNQEPCVTQKGTVISVKNLFFNVPARRKFLKSQAVEKRHIIDEFERVALAHPEVAFSLYHNDSELFQLPKSNHRQRIVNIFGKRSNEKLVPVEEETELVKIHGFVGKPKYSKRSKGEQFFFVNNRFVKSAYLYHAIKSAYEGLLQDGKNPAYFLYLEIDPQSIDINIHPTKTEIKFDDEHAVYAILRSAVKHGLGQFNVMPSLDFKHNSEFDTPYSYKNKTPEMPKIEVDRNFNPFVPEHPISASNTIPENKANSKPTVSRSFYAKPSKTESWESLYTGLNTPESTPKDFASVEFESEAVTGTLFSSDQVAKESGIFQLQKKYIISALKSGMMVIHQHRAHYRILYEEFLKNITVEANSSQQLLFPLVLSFSVKEIEMLKTVRDSLEHTGFDFASIENSGVHINGIPGMITESEVNKILDDVLTDLERDLPENDQKNAKFLARTLAKNTAIKTGVQLSHEEQNSIINRLFACKESTLTPDNKTIFIRLDAEDLDKKFM